MEAESEIGSLTIRSSGRLVRPINRERIDEEPEVPARRLSHMVKMMVVSMALLLAACGTPAVIESSTTTRAADPPVNTPTTTTAPLPAGPEGELAAARARWDAAGLDTYSYRFYDDCGECMPEPEATVAVWDGELMSANRYAASIEEAFALIEAAIDRGTDVDVEYHPELGYPVDLWIDREARAYDGGTHLLFQDVTPGLPGKGEASLETLADAAARWSASGVDDYEYHMAVICDCAYAARTWTRVVDGKVTDFEAEPVDDDMSITPTTIDSLFDDLLAILAGEDAPQGYEVTGSALYDDALGYPVWIGLDLDLVDPGAVGDEPPFPPRLVVTIDGLHPIEVEPDAELEQARATWDSARLDSYTFDIVFHDVVEADFTDTFTVEVATGEIVAVSDTGNGYEYAPEDVLVPTINEVFDLIEQWRLEGATVDVIYDVTYGYPAVVVATRSDGWNQGISIDLLP